VELMPEYTFGSKNAISSDCVGDGQINVSAICPGGRRASHHAGAYAFLPTRSSQHSLCATNVVIPIESRWI